MKQEKEEEEEVAMRVKVNTLLNMVDIPLPSFSLIALRIQ